MFDIFFGRVTVFHVGIISTVFGPVLGFITADSFTGGLVTVAGLITVGCGLWSAVREQVVKDARNRECEAVRMYHEACVREQEANKERDEALHDLSRCRAHIFRLRVRLGETTGDPDPAL